MSDREEDRIPIDVGEIEVTSTGTDTDLYDYTDIYTVVLEEVTISNNSGGPAEVVLVDRGATNEQKLSINIADGETANIDEIRREFKESGVVQVTTDSQPIKIGGSGYMHR